MAPVQDFMNGEIMVVRQHVLGSTMFHVDSGFVTSNVVVFVPDLVALGIRAANPDLMTIGNGIVTAISS